MNKDTFDIIIATTGTILAVISLIFGIYKSRNTSLAYKRVMEVYEPIFNCLEKYLFKYNPTKEFNDAIEKCANIIMNNRAMFGYGLYDSFNEFTQTTKRKTVNKKVTFQTTLIVSQVDSSDSIIESVKMQVYRILSFHID